MYPLFIYLSIWPQLKVFFWVKSGTEFGEPSRDQNIGETHLPYSVFLDYTLSLAKTKYK